MTNQLFSRSESFLFIGTRGWFLEDNFLEQHVRLWCHSATVQDFFGWQLSPNRKSPVARRPPTTRLILKMMNYARRHVNRIALVIFFCSLIVHVDNWPLTDVWYNDRRDPFVHESDDWNFSMYFVEFEKKILFLKILEKVHLWNLFIFMVKHSLKVSISVK